MSIIIKQVQLKNWFNYKGDYDANTFNFNNGLNIIVGDNNAGKTKLHNAFRYILTNEIILSDKDAQGSRVYVKAPIDDDNIRKVLNTSVFTEMKLNELVKIGIKIKFEEFKSEFDNHVYVLTKELTCRKDVNSLIITSKTENVQIVDPRTKSPRKTTDEFDIIAQKIIHPNFMHFFFVEGEQLGLMTPLEGANLKRTINSIVNLQVFDEIERLSKEFVTTIDKKRSSIEKEEKAITATRLSDLEKIEDYKKTIAESEESIIEEASKRNKSQALIDKYRQSAEDSRKRRALIKELSALDNGIEVAEATINNSLSRHISQMMNQSTFSLSKITDDWEIEEKVKQKREEIKSFIAERRLELDTKLAEKEHKMIMALEKSQPKPEIIEQMVHDGTCYVCSNPLSEASVQYMTEKLIPFFKDELDDDTELNNLSQINNMFNGLLMSSKKYFSKNETFFQDFDEEIMSLTSKRIEAVEAKAKFIEINGDLESDKDIDGGEVSIITYDRAVQDLRDAEKAIKHFQELINESKRQIKDLEKKNKVPEDSESQKLKSAKLLYHFSQDLHTHLEEIKDKEYTRFTESLEEKATIRFRSFMENNIAARNHLIRVIKTKNVKGDYEFRIVVYDKFNEEQGQPGGADEALRSVAVVFGLLDMADNKRGYPFIADAPISKLSPDTKKSFFTSLLNDKAINQCIILNMDLWSAKKQEINDLGEEVLNTISGLQDSSFITIIPNPNNQGVQIEYLKR